METKKIDLKPCPFCGKSVNRVRGWGGLNFFKCTNRSECGAVMSFDNDYFNQNPEKAINAYNRRNGAMSIKNDGHITINIGGKK